MKLLFENKKLENNISNIDNVKEWAKPLKKNLTKIIKYLKSVNSFKEMFTEKMFGLHHLHSDRETEWTMKIDYSYRLIFSLCDDEGNVIINKDCVNIANSIKILLIKEVSNHYAK